MLPNLDPDGANTLFWNLTLTNTLFRVRQAGMATAATAPDFDFLFVGTAFWAVLGHTHRDKLVRSKGPIAMRQSDD
ncbi:MAG: hypothetical protein P9E24_03935 [Candidatus Competibacter sp.]|nr:hypothetical protein [Candidatus Competibacter sp.]MDG4583994.1 hypothetical protein [Candidatus Competibacter sp.]